MALATVVFLVYNDVQYFYTITLSLSALPVHHERAGDADQPQRRPGLQFHHPVNFRSHLTSLRNRTKPTRTGACRPVPTVNYPISAHLRSDNPRPQSFDCNYSAPHLYRRTVPVPVSPMVKASPSKPGAPCDMAAEHDMTMTMTTHLRYR
eukprot:COSAG02_NODE_17184_length_1022_cov_11.007584_1_plen_150_part_00